MTTACAWWNRWWHRRKREADVLCLLPALAQAAAARVSDSDDEQRWIDAAFALHASLPGQEHWRCDCARLEWPWVGA
jgi:hypothetical protein